MSRYLTIAIRSSNSWSWFNTIPGKPTIIPGPWSKMHGQERFSYLPFNPTTPRPTTARSTVTAARRGPRRRGRGWPSIATAVLPGSPSESPSKHTLRVGRDSDNEAFSLSAARSKASHDASRGCNRDPPPGEHLMTQTALRPPGTPRAHNRVPCRGPEVAAKASLPSTINGVQEERHPTRWRRRGYSSPVFLHEVWWGCSAKDYISEDWAQVRAEPGTIQRDLRWISGKMLAGICWDSCRRSRTQRRWSPTSGIRPAANFTAKGSTRKSRACCAVAAGAARPVDLGVSRGKSPCSSR
jgi:hypothetical protein